MTRFAVVLAIGLCACGGSPPAAQQPTPAATADDPSCPVLVPGTSVTVEDTQAGAAFVFVTTGDAAAVQARARTLAAMHATHDGPAGAMGMMIDTPSAATAAAIDHGARVEFAAQGDAVAQIQSELRMHAQHLAGGSCKMSM